MRKLATIQRIAEVKTIENADKIVAYRIGGWVVVDSKGKYQVGDKVVYCEVDSWIPTEIAPFLSKGNEPKEFNGVKGERLRSIRLKKQVSQGLLLPTAICPIVLQPAMQEGDDVTGWLGIQKYEAPIPACLAGDARGMFPSAMPKTDQERAQNLSDKLNELSAHTYEVTEKLNGSSCTLWLDNEADFHVCSRNLDLKETESNSYWKAARKYDVEQKMKDLGLKGLAIQGELIGEGINGNQYKTSLDFYVFDMYDAVFQRYLTSSERLVYCEKLGLKHVPVLCNSFSIGMDGTVDSLLAYAEGKSELNGSEREGCVFVSTCDPSLSFKAVSNKWLIKTGE